MSVGPQFHERLCSFGSPCLCRSCFFPFSSRAEWSSPAPKSEKPGCPYIEPGRSFLFRLAGEKKAYTALLQCRTFLCRKKWGLQRKDFGGGYGFPGFYRVFVSTTGLESFSFGPEKFSKRFSFGGGGGVRFFLLWVRSFLLTVGLGCLSRSLWQVGSVFFLAVEIRFGLCCLWWRIGLVSLTYGPSVFFLQTVPSP